MNNQESGNVPHKYGMSRWSRPRRYACAHECETEATILSPGCPGRPYAHNCCAMHKVVLELDRYEAKELANYLDQTDMHLSVGDRLTLAHKLYRLLEGDKQ